VVLPRMDLIARQILHEDPGFSALIPAARLGYTVPTPVTAPFVRVQCPNASPANGDLVLWRPLIQVDAYAPPGDTAEDVVWNLVATAGQVLHRTRNRTVGDVTLSGRLVDGPIPGYDTSRGESTPLVRCTVRAVLALHLR